MTIPNVNVLLALFGGALLAIMIKLNSSLASFTTPVFASWLAHGIGTLVALLLLALLAKSGKVNQDSNRKLNAQKSAPLWSYFGGLPGALVVVFAAITVNSELGLSGTLVLGLIGQVIFGLVCDHFRLFGVPKQAITINRLVSILPILAGSGLIIFFRSAS